MNNILVLLTMKHSYKAALDLVSLGYKVSIITLDPKHTQVKKISGYIIPKNDEYFNEYIDESIDRLKFISNFSGSAGFAVILRHKNFLFVDGRYTIQAEKQAGKKFKIITIPKKFPCLEVSGEDNPRKARIKSIPDIK